jgi:glycosyltransferase involved in cell wall biosynthesis
MLKILFVIPTLDYSGAATQIALLASAWPCDRGPLCVAALGSEGPAADLLRAAGVEVVPLGRARILDLAAGWRLRRRLRDWRPDVIHAWGRRSWRVVALAGGRGGSRFVVSAPLPAARRGRLGRLDRWLLGGVDRIIARGPAEAGHYRRAGLPADKIVIVPPAALRHPLAERVDDKKQGSAPDIVCVGPLEVHKGFRDAIWAFDILQFIYPDLRLLVAGTGPERARLEQFARAINPDHGVRFLGPQADVRPLLARAQVVWVPSLALTGVNVALEAMALGRPVVAARLPGLAEVVGDGETGLLAGPRDKVELARQTRRLLEDPALRRRLGEAARRRVERFSVAELAARLGDVYAGKKKAA